MDSSSEECFSEEEFTLQGESMTPAEEEKEASSVEEEEEREKLSDQEEESSVLEELPVEPSASEEDVEAAVEVEVEVEVPKPKLAKKRTASSFRKRTVRSAFSHRGKSKTIKKGEAEKEAAEKKILMNKTNTLKPSTSSSSPEIRPQSPCKKISFPGSSARKPQVPTKTAPPVESNPVENPSKTKINPQLFKKTSNLVPILTQQIQQQVQGQQQMQQQMQQQQTKQRYNSPVKTQSMFPQQQQPISNMWNQQQQQKPSDRVMSSDMYQRSLHFFGSNVLKKSTENSKRELQANGLLEPQCNDFLPSYKIPISEEMEMSVNSPMQTKYGAFLPLERYHVDPRGQTNPGANVMNTMPSSKALLQFFSPKATIDGWNSTTHDASSYYQNQPGVDPLAEINTPSNRQGSFGLTGHTVLDPFNFMHRKQERENAFGTLSPNNATSKSFFSAPVPSSTRNFGSPPTFTSAQASGEYLNTNGFSPLVFPQEDTKPVFQQQQQPFFQQQQQQQQQQQLPVFQQQMQQPIQQQMQQPMQQPMQQQSFMNSGFQFHQNQQPFLNSHFSQQNSFSAGGDGFTSSLLSY